MSELRYNPLTRDWVMVVSSRQNRPNMPKDFCPFCPGSGKVPETYDVLKYDNDFPALSTDPPRPEQFPSPLFRTAPLYGKCEVILYSSDHCKTLPELSVSHLCKLVELWCERFLAISQDSRVKYILIFENRGELVGTTMPHPHGQIYGYPWVPKKLELETEACRDYYGERRSCLYCDLLRAEREDGRRIIFENEHFTVFLPYCADFPYGIRIASKAHVQNLGQFSPGMKTCLAATLKDAVATLDALFDKPMPYMMVMHQNPVNGRDYTEDYHFHIEFYPPMRSASQILWRASSETGAWASCNPTSPEEKAQELRDAYDRVLAQRSPEGQEG